MLTQMLLLAFIATNYPIPTCELTDKVVPIQKKNCIYCYYSALNCYLFLIYTVELPKEIQIKVLYRFNSSNFLTASFYSLINYIVINTVENVN